MPRIKIHNFGPIKTGYKEDDGFLDISRVTVFIGNQGSGKSTVAKLISTFLWMEKTLVRGDFLKDDFTANNFIEKRLAHHRLSDEYHKNNPELVYDGEAYHFTFKNGELKISKKDAPRYALPQIMYVPAERSIVTSVGNAAKLKNISGALSEFITEYGNAKEAISDSVMLPINGTSAEYDKTHDVIYIRGNNYRIKLTDAASGFQSLVPLYLVSRYLCNSIKSFKNGESMSSEEKRRFEKQLEEITRDPNLSDEQKRIARSNLGKSYNKAVFINIVEEPELNLFPGAQKDFLYELLKFNNTIRENETEHGNRVIITTHSPYLINFLSVAIYGAALSKKIDSSGEKESLKNELLKVVPQGALTSIDDVSIYQLSEVDGSIKKLSSVEGIPSDNNLLNNLIQQGNQEFDKLLKIEETLEC
ncbi:ATPase AAA [Treponema sp. R8-4-B8]